MIIRCPSATLAFAALLITACSGGKEGARADSLAQDSALSGATSAMDSVAGATATVPRADTTRAATPPPANRPSSARGASARESTSAAPRRMQPRPATIHPEPIPTTKLPP